MFIFDSSTLILLAKIEILDRFLRDYKGDVIIPGKVEKESTNDTTFEALLIKKKIKEGRIKVRHVQSDKVRKIIEDFNVNSGEAEAIILALTNKNGTLATDDKNAINACKLLDVPFTASIHILLRAKEKNLMTMEEARAKLDKLSKYGRLKKIIIEDARRRLK
ncbi:MAG: hypothetical protein AABX74_02220 [Nanoarchaeota archaeon]